MANYKFKQIHDDFDLGEAEVGDYFLGQKLSDPLTAGTLTFAPKVEMDPAPQLAADLTLNGNDIIGNLSVTNYNSGTDASASTYLRGDGTWVNPTTANGSVATGTLNQLAYYAADGNQVSGTNSLPTGTALGTPTSGTLTNCTGLPVSTGISGLGTGVANFLATPSSANLASAVTGETGSGALVFGTSPTIDTPVIANPTVSTGTFTSPALVTPALGTPASGVLTNCTGLPVSTGVSGLGTNVATFLTTPSSANLAAALTDETGTGVAVFATAPTIDQPIINGITDGSAAAAGVVGQEVYNTGSIAAGLISSGTNTNIASLSLPAGDWLVYGDINYGAPGTTITAFAIAINNVSATLPTYFALTRGVNSGLGTERIGTAVARFNVTSTTTIYLIGYLLFSGTAPSAEGQIYAKRIR